jgi:hypothetical protein
MAKKPSVKGLFEKTTGPAQDTEEDKAKKRRPIGLYLRLATRAEVEKIAAAEDLPVHAVLAYAVAYFVREYRKGKVKIETTKKTTLNLDV